MSDKDLQIEQLTAQVARLEKDKIRLLGVIEMIGIALVTGKIADRDYLKMMERKLTTLNETMDQEEKDSNV